MLVWIDKNTAIGAPTVLAQLSRLMRLTLGTEGFGSATQSTKSDVVYEFVQDTPENYQWVVTSYFRQSIKNLSRRFTGEVVCSHLTGESDRGRSLEDFDRGRSRVLLMTAQTGGEGLSLSKARGLISLDLPWSSTQYFQLCRRVVRGDQKFKHVRVIRVLAKGTVDELLVDLHKQKRPLSPKEMVREVQAFLDH